MRKRKCKKYLLILLLLLCLTTYLVLLDTVPPKVKARFPVGPRQGYNPFITTFPWKNMTARVKWNNNMQEVPVKTILLWTEFFGSKHWLTGAETFKSCAVQSCRVTMEKGEVGEADAVLMNVRNIYSPSDLPPVHPPHQVWIIHGSEPPYYVEVKLEHFNNVFNWTSWYRTDADIFSPYGHFTPIGPASSIKPNDTHQVSPQREPAPSVFQPNFLSEDTNPHPQPSLADHSVDDPFSLHDRLVFWMASSCINYSQRYKTVAALQKFLPVDTFGACGTKTCQKDSRACDELLQRYKFVLAFENGYCRDYVTEKYWNAIDRKQIPVVSGGADYARVAIPGSYIDVDNFTSIGDLASFLLRVASDRRLYNSFFAWRSRYRLLPYGVCNWCQMCAALHHQSRAPQVYSDFRGWVAEDTCPVHSYFHYNRWLFQYVRFKTFGI